MQTYINGQFYPPEEASISVDDAGLQHAVGLFETLAVRNGRAFRLEQHLQRLATSASELGLTRSLDTEALKQAVEQAIAHNNATDARLRLTITAGRISLLRDAAEKTPGLTVLIQMTPPTAFDPAAFEKGVTVLIAPPLANPFDPLAGHKTLSYWGRLRVLRQAASVGAAEAIIRNVSNHLASGAVSNLFLVHDGRLLTPFARGEETRGALPAPVLPGITRAAIIELAEKEGLTVERRMLSIDDLLQAQEVFLTNSSWFVLPVTRVEKHTVGEGTPGPITTRLREALLTLFHTETRN